MQTLRRMKGLVLDAIQHDEMRQTAISLHQSAFIPRPDEYAHSVLMFLRNSYIFTYDPGEMLIHPLRQLKDLARNGIIYADCDDISMMASALLTVFGYQTRFKAVAPAPDGSFRHVFCEWNFGSEGDPNWIPMDPMVEGRMDFPGEFITLEV